LAPINNIWQNIINVEVKKLGNADSETKLATLGKKMTRLSRTYRSYRVFPLHFLVKILETLSIRWNGSPGNSFYGNVFVGSFKLFEFSIK
jgi:nuclear pore complex protein Nup155